LLTGKGGVDTMNDEEIIKSFEIIKKSGELVLEHYQSRGFRNSVIEVGIRNIVDICKITLEQVTKEKTKE
jgi:dTDP-4-amino-4,6-dideoxygalactose transaminase